jgi:hypothetical protein
MYALPARIDGGGAVRSGAEGSRPHSRTWAAADTGAHAGDLADGDHHALEPHESRGWALTAREP